MMWEWHGFGGGWMWLFWILIIFIVLFLVKGVTGNDRGQGHVEESAIEILKKCYARGEIDDEEFRRKKEELDH